MHLVVDGVYIDSILYKPIYLQKTVDNKRTIAYGCLQHREHSALQPLCQNLFKFVSKSSNPGDITRHFNLYLADIPPMSEPYLISYRRNDTAIYHWQQSFSNAHSGGFYRHCGRREKEAPNGNRPTELRVASDRGHP